MPYKPNDLATILTGVSTRRRVIEIISKPFPLDNEEGTGIKIRLVPGEPTTLAEVNVNDLLPYQKRRWVQIARVNYRFHFPEDMLRYDYAALFESGIVETSVEENPVLIYRVVDKLSRDWTHGRWESFSAHVTPVCIIDLKTEVRTILEKR